jgi:hypothetical protein
MMGIIDFLKAPKKATPEAAIAAMEEQLERLRAELRDAHAVVSSHSQRRDAAMLTDVSDADIARLDADADLASIRAERLELAELELEERLSRARDESARQKVAAEREAQARAVEEAALPLEKAIDALAEEFGKFASAVPTVNGALYFDSSKGTSAMTPIEVARTILAEGLSARLPDAFISLNKSLIGTTYELALYVPHRRRDGYVDFDLPKLPKGEEIRFLQASGVADALVVAPLRCSADAIRNGEIAPSEPPVPIRPRPIVEPPPFKFQRVYLLKRITYVNELGSRVHEDAGDTNLLEPAAERALASGAAVPIGDPRAEDHWHGMLRDPYKTRAESNQEAVDLGIDLKAMQDAERARLNPHLREAAE